MPLTSEPNQFSDETARSTFIPWRQISFALKKKNKQADKKDNNGFVLLFTYRYLQNNNISEISNVTFSRNIGLVFL